jgi:hypothetical protein
MPMMREVEGYVLFCLGDQDHVTSKGVSNTGLIKDVRVTSSQITNHYLRACNERYNIIDHDAVLPDIVGPLTQPLAIGGGGFERVPDWVEGGAERHHHGKCVLAQAGPVGD